LSSERANITLVTRCNTEF